MPRQTGPSQQCRPTLHLYCHQRSELKRKTHLLQIDHRFPELVLQLVEIPHADLPEVTRVVFVEIRSVVMLTTSHTTTTGMLAVLADTAVAGGYVAATVELKVRLVGCRFERAASAKCATRARMGSERTAFWFLSIE